MTYLRDTSAVLALLKREPGHERVAVLMAGGRCLVSAVNWAETATKLADSGQAAPFIKAALDALNPAVIPFDAAQATETGLLRPATQRTTAPRRLPANLRARLHSPHTG